MTIGILPTGRAIAAVALLAALATAALALQAQVSVVAVASGAALGLAVAVAALDVLSSRRALAASPLVWQRRLPPALAVGTRTAIEGTLTNAGPRRWHIALFDGVDPSFDAVGLPASGEVLPASVLVLRYDVLPRRRGAAHLEAAELRVRTILGSCELRVAAGAPATVRVYPNFATVARYAWLAGDRRLSEIGIKSYPMRGSGTDFKQLADYRPGDAIRDIDWKATLRHGRPIVREYQDERDQSVVFLLDCGRRMRADEGAAARRGSHFDAALEALMLLAFVALKEGDEVGAMTFGGRPDDVRSVAPRKGAHSLHALIGALHDVEPQQTQPDFRAAAARLMKTLRKRSLVVVLTNFRAEDADELAPALALLRTRHLVLLASLRERALREIAEQPLVVERDAIEVGGAHLFAQERDDAFARLAARDAYLLDVEPEHVAVELVNRYRAIKRAQLL